MIISAVGVLISWLEAIIKAVAYRLHESRIAGG